MEIRKRGCIPLSILWKVGSIDTDQCGDSSDIIHDPNEFDLAAEYAALPGESTHIISGWQKMEHEKWLRSCIQSTVINVTSERNSNRKHRPKRFEPVLPDKQDHPSHGIVASLKSGVKTDHSTCVRRHEHVELVFCRLLDRREGTKPWKEGLDKAIRYIFVFERKNAIS